MDSGWHWEVDSSDHVHVSGRQARLQQEIDSLAMPEGDHMTCRSTGYRRDRCSLGSECRATRGHMDDSADIQAEILNELHKVNIRLDVMEGKMSVCQAEDQELSTT